MYESTVELVSHKNNGIKVTDGWINTGKGDTEIQAIIQKVNKGDEIQYDFEEINESKIFTSLEIIKSSENDDIIGLETLLSMAHEKGLEAIHTELLEHNPEKKYAIVHATVQIREKNKELKEFQGIGDADQVNTTDFVRPHYIRMAETRAICRALRWATNSGTAKEEMGDPK